VPEYEAVLRDLHTDIAGLAALAEQLLRVGAVASGTAVREQPAAGDLARVVVALSGSRDEQHGSLLPASWTADCPAPGTVGVPMPEPAIRQMVLNLLTNAGVHGAPPVQVTVRVRAAGDRAVAVLTVCDAGAGMSADLLPTAVERFRRADTARALPGAGLGLSLVHALVEASSGELRLCSRGVHHRVDHRYDLDCSHPLDGTAVTVLLPALSRPRGGASCSPPAHR
jgi:signal transduction histidine kinase